MTLGEMILLKRKEKAIPELNKLISLAEILDVSIGWLIIEESDEKK